MSKNTKKNKGELEYEKIADVGGDPSQWAFPVRFDSPHEVIRASAGSGKTYQLSNRYLGLLRNDIAAEQMLATTFTRKAAGEILERILTRLAEAASSEDAAAELADGLLDDTLDCDAARQMLVRLCHALHRVSVSTIDSFFNRVAQVFRHELRLPPEPYIAGNDDPIVMQLRAQAIDAMLGDDDTQTLVDLLRRLHHDKSQRSVTSAIDDIVTALYETYRMAEPDAWSQLEVGDLLSDASFAAAVDALNALAESQTAKRLKNALLASAQLLRQHDLVGFLSKGPGKAITADPESPMFYGKPLPDDVVSACRPLISHAAAVQVNAIRERTLAMFELVQRFDAHFTTLREANHVLLYADLPHRLIQYMRQVREANNTPIDTDNDVADIPNNQWNTDLHYRLDTRVSHLLLDEFQDTSFEQWEVLKPFADEITAMTDHSRSFFCVGDVKQAIYGWRGGRAEIFDRLSDDLQLDDDAIRQLDDNYRSSQTVLDAVNQVFTSLGANIALQDDDLYQHEASHWQALFAKHTAVRDQHGYVELCTTPALPSDDDDADTPAWTGHNSSDDDNGDSGESGGGISPSHLDAVATRVQQLHNDAPGFSIGVLASTNQSVRQLLYLLGQRGVPVSGEGGVAIVGDPAINLIMAALQLADHPGDQVAAWALFNSPMRDALPLPSTLERDRLDAAWRIRSAVQTEGYTATIERWAAALAQHCDHDSARRLTQLVALADNFEPTGSPRMRDFMAYVEGAQVEAPSAASVRVMTVHKAKGLEFDIVVLPELGKELGRVSSEAVLVDQDDAAGVIRAVHAYAPAAIRALSPQLEEAYRQEKARRIREGLCVLYVAMTRARHALHLMVEPLQRKANGEFGKRGHSDHSFAAFIRSALNDADVVETDEGSQQLFTLGDAAWFAHETAKPAPAPITLALPRFTTTKPDDNTVTRNRPSVSPSAMQAGERTAGDLFDIKPSLGNLRGSVIHAWFEQIEWLADDEELPAIDWWAAARSAVSIPLSDDWLSEQLAQFETMLQCDVIRTALSKPATPADESAGESVELWRERAFAVTTDEHVLKGMFDRVVIKRHGQTIKSVALIDFKTDNASDAVTLDAHVAKYRPQINAYCDALCRLLAIDRTVIEASLLFVGSGVRAVL